MRADDDVDAAVRQARPHLRQFCVGHQPRGLRDIDRKTAEPLGEGLEMLARQQRRRHHHGHLLAADRGEEGRAQRDFRLAEADVAADEPVHRPAGAEILDGGVDGGELVVGFLVGKSGAEFVIGARPHAQARRLAQLPLGRDLDQLAGDLADAALHARLARLPVAAAQPIELDADLLRAVARQQVDVLHRQKQLGVVGVTDFEAIVRRAGRFDRLQAGEAPDAVIDVHDQIARRQTGHLGDEILRALHGAARTHQPVAENVLLADDGRVFGLETALDAEHRERDGRLRQRQRLRPGADRREIVQLVIGQHVAHALARALAPQRDRHALAGGLQGEHVLAHRLEHIGARLGALGGEIVPGARADLDHAVRFRHRERGQLARALRASSRSRHSPSVR